MDDYNEILDFFNLGNRTRQETKLWCYEKILNLMFKYIENPNRIEIKNSLILILNLFFIDTPDRFHSQGRDYITLTENEKSQVLKIISKELRG